MTYLWGLLFFHEMVSLAHFTVSGNEDMSAQKTFHGADMN